MICDSSATEAFLAWSERVWVQQKNPVTLSVSYREYLRLRLNLKSYVYGYSVSNINLEREKERERVCVVRVRVISSAFHLSIGYKGTMLFKGFSSSL